jgi:hypothetical protein
MAAGQTIVGLYIVPGTTIISVGGSSLIMSAPAQSTSTEVVKTYANPLSFFSVRTVVAGNTSHHNLFDGIDVSSDSPHSNRANMYMSVTGNASCYNFGTGIFGDGNYATIAGNTTCYNESWGIEMDNAFSTIVGNSAFDNNLEKDPGAGQIGIGFTGFVGGSNGGNIIVGNHADTSTNSGINGAGIFANNEGGPFNVMQGNYTTGGLTDNIVGASAGTFNGLTLSGATTDTRVNTFLSLAPSSFSPLMQAHDAITFFDINGANDTGGYVIAAHSMSSIGLRIDPVAKTVQVGGGLVIQQGTPATSGAPCATGQITFDASFAYFCASTNNWKRVGILAF